MKKTTTISRSARARTVAVARLRESVYLGLAFLLLLAMPAVVCPVRAQLSSNPGVLLADFNGDGIQDVLIPSPSTGSFTLTFGAVPFGTFSAVSKSVPYPSGCTTVVTGGVAIGDFNGDGLADIALTCTHTPSEFLSFTTYVLTGSGDGSFNLSATLTGLPFLAAGDFNHDGKLDLVGVAPIGQGTGSIAFNPGNGDGTFGTAVTTTIPFSNLNSVLAVDLNADGYPCLVLGYNGGQNGNNVSIYGNNQDGTFGVPGDNFSSPNALVITGTSPASNDTTILSGNFFGSGRPDLAVVDTGTTPGVYIIQNNSNDGFSFGTAAKTAVPGLTVATAGSFTTTFSDLLVSNGATLSVLANDGTGKFAATYAALSVASTSTLFSAADANLDGHADIYTAALTSTGVSLAVNLVSGTASASSTPFQLPVGSSPVSALWPGNVNFVGSTLTGTQIVGGITPTITWPAPAPITYGTALSATQLDAVATTAAGAAIPGTYVYSPAAGTVPGVGTQTLNVTFTPTDLVTYTVATGTVSLVVNRATPVVSWTPAVGTISYGTAIGAAQLNATATGVGGIALPGTFVYAPASGTVLGAGTQNLTVVFTPTDAADYLVAQGTAQITVNKALPTISWATPAPIAYGVPLSATQLDATVAGITGAALPGTFVYTPAAGSVVNPGTQTLSVKFTPTDAVDYLAATAAVNLTVTNVTLSSFTPNTATLGAPATTITITGSGLVSTTVVQINGTAIPTTLVNPTTLTAVIPPSDFLVPGALQVTLMNPTTGSSSGALSFTVTAPPLNGTLTGPPTTAPGTQPSLTFNIQPYPVDITATLTVTLKSSIASGVTDVENVVFANGSSTYTFTVPAGSTSIPAIPLAAGTIAETITVTPTLFVGTTNVTPDGLAPAVIDVPAGVPQATSITLTRSGNQITVKIIGFSNTREIVSAAFHFVAAPGSTLTQSDFSPTVNGIFTNWFDDDPTSPDYGSGFTYTQVFDVSDLSTSIGSVQVTLTNSIGTSTMETAQ